MQSMTGFGRGEARRDGLRMNAQISAVNHRHCDIRFTMPRELSPLEKDLRDRIRHHIHRGSLQVSLELICEEPTPDRLRLDLQLAKDLQRQAAHLRQELGLTGDLTIRDLLAIPDMLILQQPPIPQALLQQLALDSLDQALHSLLAMRRAEGDTLAQDLQQRLDQITTHIATIGDLAPRVPHHYRTRLQQRLADLLPDTDDPIDQDRLLKEIALFADKADISEEVTRLTAHAHQLHLLLQQDDPIGRKVDFFLQEMNREVNTIGSKANDQHIAQLVVDIKTEVERMREQANNVQ